MYFQTKLNIQVGLGLIVSIYLDYVILLADIFLVYAVLCLEEFIYLLLKMTKKHLKIVTFKIRPDTFKCHVLLNTDIFKYGYACLLLVIRMKVTIVKEQHVTVMIDGRISVMVLLHRVWKKHPVQVDFLGIYMSSDNKYSEKVHGLIGGSLNV